MDPTRLYASPNALAPCYSRFRVAERLLLTGHSHQAWPDCARDGQLAAFDDAAAAVDGKWERAFAVADRVRRGFAGWLGEADRLAADGGPSYALGANTHELVIRFLSALDLRARPRLVTTDGEFHTIRRQLARLEEEGIEVVRVPVDDEDDNEDDGGGATGGEVAERLVAAVDQRTAAVLVSSVFFLTGRIARNLGVVARAARAAGAELLVDSYHSLGAVPLDLAAEGLDDAYVIGGGYKYLQLGEGNCFLRVPPARRPRPAITGWFAEFEQLEAPPRPGGVAYGAGAAAYAGSTYDPTSHYRAAAVMDFFAERGLTADLLRRVSQHQIGLLARRFDALDLPPRVIGRRRDAPIGELGGFLALDTPHAEELCAALRRRGVATDHRGEVLRFGPAPYISDAQLEAAMDRLREAAAEIG